MKAFLIVAGFLFFSFCTKAQSWQDLNKQVKKLSDSAQYEKAIPIAQKAIEIAKSEFGETDSSYAISLTNLAHLYKDMGRYEKAEPLFMEAIPIWKKVFGEIHTNYATSLNDLAVLYYIMGRYEKAEPLFVEAMTIWKKTLGETHPYYATSLNNLAGLYERMGLYEKSELFHLEAMAMRKKLVGEMHPDYANSLNNLGGLYRSMGRYEKAETVLMEAMMIRKKVFGEFHRSYAASLANLAEVYDNMGQYKKAELLYMQAMTIRKKVLGENHPEYAASLADLAALYINTGQYIKAEPLYMEAIAIDKKMLGMTHPSYATDLYNLAGLYKKMGQYEKSEPLYEEALTIRKKVLGENHPSYAASLNNLADLYRVTGLYEKAETFFAEALTIRKKALGENHPNYAASLNNLAELYRVTGRYEKAEPLFMEAMAIQKKALGETHPDYARSLNNLARLYECMGLYEKAEPLVLQNSAIVKKNVENNFSGMSEKEKQSYLDNTVTIINSENSFLYNYKKASIPVVEHIGNTQLFFKGLILDNTKKMLVLLQQSKDTAVVNVYNNWLYNKTILSKQYSLSIARRSSDLKQREEKTEMLEKELTRMSADFKNQQEAIRINMQDVGRGLKQNEVAIEFVKFTLFNKKITDSTIYAAYILHKNDSVPVFVPLFEERQLQKLFDSAGATATAMVSKFYRGLEVKSKNAAGVLGTELYKLIWQPMEPYLKNIKKISYSPAGKLYSIAFHALPVNGNTVLMDKYQLQQYNSTRQVVLREQQKQGSKPQKITLFGDASFTLDSLLMIKDKTKTDASSTFYTVQNRGVRGGAWSNLPGTAKEVKAIQRVFEQNKISTKTFTQTNASEENLKALSGNSPQILHIATHGFFLPEPDKKKSETGFSQANTYTLADDPLLRSGLILSGGNYAWSGKTPIDGVEDGIATAYEISQLNLSNTELVVLSACETALGDVKGSEGVFGLQRGFKMAGVKKMIVSLWQVPDKETAELMTAFYNYWMKGKTINDAFTQAQADMRKKYSPFYWAAFVLVE